MALNCNAKYLSTDENEENHSGSDEEEDDDEMPPEKNTMSIANFSLSDKTPPTLNIMFGEHELQWHIVIDTVR